MCENYLESTFSNLAPHYPSSLLKHKCNPSMSSNTPMASITSLTITCTYATTQHNLSFYYKSHIIIFILIYFIFHFIGPSISSSKNAPSISPTITAITSITPITLDANGSHNGYFKLNQSQFLGVYRYQ